MPQIRPIAAVQFAAAHDAARGCDVSRVIAPPYDVLDEGPKQELLAGDRHNIVAIDLPFTPPKVVGPDAVYQQAGRTYRNWLEQGVLVRGQRPALFVYQQSYRHNGKQYHRRGLIANLRVQAFGPAPDGRGGIWPHEQTFSSGKEDRLRLMRATGVQLSPIFGLYSDAAAGGFGTRGQIGQLLSDIADRRVPSCAGTTANDHVLHSVWEVTDQPTVDALTGALADKDIYIADGHHRYNTAINYRDELRAAGRLAADDAEAPANFCMFVLVAMQDPGMIILPTHRVLGGMAGFSMSRLVEAARGKLRITAFAGQDLAALERALPTAGLHAVGLYDPANPAAPLAVATTLEADPLAATHGDHVAAWRQLDVAIVQHLLVEGICHRAFGVPDPSVRWKFPHTLDQLKVDAHTDGYQLGVIVQPTALDSVVQVSQAGELMPQKSTFFYPKLATGLVI